MINERKELPSFAIGEYIYKYPIVQGGMSVGVSGVGLHLAVTKEGGLSFLGGVGLGYRSDYFRKQHKSFFEADRLVLRDKLLKIREIDPDATPAVNFLCAAVGYDSLVRTAVENGAKTIASGAGLPLKLPQLTEGHPKVKIVPIVASAQGVRIICQRWWKMYRRLPDAIVIENPKTAGGHLGLTPKQDIDDEEFKPEIAIPDSLTWLEDFKKKIGMTGANTPIIAAGGIWTYEDILKVLKLGASAAQLGSRFVCTEECDAPLAFKEKYLEAKQEDIVLIKSPVGIPGRAIKTKLLDMVSEGKIKDGCPIGCLASCTNRDDEEGGPYCIIRRLTEPNVENSIVFAGSNAWRSEKIVPVHQVFEELTGKLQDVPCSIN